MRSIMLLVMLLLILSLVLLSAFVVIVHVFIELHSSVWIATESFLHRNDLACTF
jgi:hypothetical protein